MKFYLFNTGCLRNKDALLEKTIKNKTCPLSGSMFQCQESSTSALTNGSGFMALDIGPALAYQTLSSNVARNSE